RRGDGARSRSVTGVPSGLGLGLGTGKAPGRACIDDLGAAVVKRHLHIAEHCDGARIHVGVESARWAFDLASVERPPFLRPGRQTTVENENIARAEDFECPPNTWRRKKPAAVISYGRVTFLTAQDRTQTGA